MACAKKTATAATKATTKKAVAPKAAKEEKSVKTAKATKAAKPAKEEKVAAAPAKKTAAKAAPKAEKKVAVKAPAKKAEPKATKKAAAKKVAAPKAVEVVISTPTTYELASKVTVAGSFNEWNQEKAVACKKDKKTGIWSAKLKLVPGSYQYKFICDDLYWDEGDNKVVEVK